MLLNRIYLRNYRVFADELELELPPGLVGIYGPNGGGKSTLVEAIRFTLFGKGRTSNDEIRTAGVKSECIAEIGFEHEGHQYLVRRTISGINSTVKAMVESDGAHVVEGVRDTSRFLQGTLGMDDAAFRASVFAEQKQLAAFSEQAPGERRRLVLSLLGITPLDSARDQARKDARDSKARFEELRRFLPDLEKLAADLAIAQAEAARLVTEADRAGAESAHARDQAAAAAGAFETLDRLRQEYERLLAEGRAARAEFDRAEVTVARLTAELAELSQAAARLDDLATDGEGWREAEAELRKLEAVAAARLVLHGLPVLAVADLTPPDEAPVEAARAAADTARSALATAEARLEGARNDLARAEAASEHSAQLSGGADCPLCGQELGDAFESVRAHRQRELAEAQARHAEMVADQGRAEKMAAAAAKAATELSRQLKVARQEWAGAETARSRREEGERQLAAAEAALGRSMEPDELPKLAAEVERRRLAFDECQRIRGRLERRADAEKALDIERAALSELGNRLEKMRAEAAALGYRPDDLEVAKAARHQAQLHAEAAAAAAQAALVAAGNEATRAQAETRRLEEAREQHVQLAELSDSARHLVRLADLLNSFRNTMVATVGPRLSAQAAELFAELTDHEYDDLAVDPDTYEIKVRDAGLLYGMSRFSGSETDLANLALRVAVSEQVRFQSGGAVGLLVLDEVFGPLDDDRKERMLMALERLRARFRQVLVVTHDAAVKEQLPAAIEVVKLPGRRATARLINT